MNEPTGKEGAAAGPSRRRPSLVIIAEPLVSPDAVQLKFVSAVARALTASFDVTIASVYATREARERLHALGFSVLAPARDHFLVNRLLHRAGLRSEATLWTEAWLRESTFGLNRRLLGRMLDRRRFEFVVNTTNTAALPSDVWWIQGPPLNVTLRSMVQKEGRSSRPLWALCELVRWFDERITERLYSAGRMTVAASNYVRQFYEREGMHVRATIYNLSDFSGFRPLPRDGEPPYVLAYIGKETELDTLYRLANRGIKVVGFGGKLVPGIRAEELRESIDFLGPVDHDRLVSLYSGAEFTVFPFTNEPFGYVPVESMACGTPVLTYGKEGPAETVVNGETGWLVHSRDEFVRMASTLWNGFDRLRFSARSVWRASQFNPETQARMLASLLLSSGPAPSGRSSRRRWISRARGSAA
jgi:glycosyltransferase involved in cell wall biosynthesis